MLLRDARPEDVEARIRWVTVELEWGDWDAPWEGMRRVAPEDVPELRRKLLSQVAGPQPTPRVQLWIERIGGPLLGWVSCYGHDEAGRSIWAGIDICEAACWGHGLGTEALGLWIAYLFQEMDLSCIRLGTWSGNVRMVRCAERCEFVVESRRAEARLVRGRAYDALEFKLDRARWEERGVGPG